MSVRRPFWASRAATMAGGVAVVMLTVVTGASASATPQAPVNSAVSAAVPAPRSVSGVQLFRLTFEDTNGGALWGDGALYPSGSTGATVAPGTSPVVVGLPGANYEILYQDGNGRLAMSGSEGTGETRNMMMPGTSPSAVYTPGSANLYQIAWQGTDGNLYTSGPDGAASNTTVAMAPNTSPSISHPTTGGGYEIAVQGLDGNLWEASNSVGVAPKREFAGLAILPHTSPATWVDAAGFVDFVWHSTDGTTWMTTPNGPAQAGQGICTDPDTSPSVTGLPGGGFEIALTTCTGHLWPSET